MPPEQQAGSNPPEKSYDSDLMADVRGAFDEAAKGEVEVKTEPEVKDEPKAEPETGTEPKPEAVKEDHPTDPKRYADGKFKPTTEEKPEAKPVEAKAPEPTAPPVTPPAQQKAQTVTGNPPGGWSVKAKAEWDKLSEHVRADILKREKEVNDGFAQYEGMRELRPYVDMARSQGQTLKQVLDRYTGIENHLRQQPLQALLHIAGNIGITPQRLAMELAPYLGHSNGQQTNGQSQDQYAAQPQFDPNMMQQWLNPLTQEVNSLKSLFQQQQESSKSREMTAINAVLDRFKADPSNRFYENVEPRMAQLFESGVVPRTGDYAADLKAAYDMACRLDPEISEHLLNEKLAKSEEARKQQEKEAAEKAKQASRSITGSPSATIKDDADAGDDSIEADVRRAYRAHAA